MNNIHYIFGLPVYKNNIIKKYDKDKIIYDINYNYNFSKERNNWDKDKIVKSTIHHSNMDENNNAFKEINYSSLNKIYYDEIHSFLKQLSLIEKIKFNCDYQIVNYTCSNDNEFMNTHIHKYSFFSFVHYVSFDSEKHVPTVFISPYYFKYHLQEEFSKIFKKNSHENSWIYFNYTLNTLEDDFIIFPSILEHCVKNSLSKNKKRITIAGNINIKI